MTKSVFNPGPLRLTPLASPHPVVAWISTSQGHLFSVLALLTFKFVLINTMHWNEADVLPLAKQFAEPGWLPHDWYLNQAPGYRVLFMALVGPVVAAWGFLAASIIGRLLTCTLMAVGLTLIGRKLGLTVSGLLVAIALFLGMGQSAIAGEWMVGGFETKAIAYGVLLLAIWALLDRRYLWMATLMGVSTSFHVLVGGWAFVVSMGWVVLGRRLQPALPKLGMMLGLYALGSAAALPAVVAQLTTPEPMTTLTVSPSSIYVFLRLPHHLDPLSWSATDWLKPLGLLVGLAVSAGWGMTLPLRGSVPRFSQYESLWVRRELVGLTLASLVPFGLGVAIAPFDPQGHFLQYYPFRLGDTLLPLTVGLLGACALQTVWRDRRQLLALGCAALLALSCVQDARVLAGAIRRLPEFPSEIQNVDLAKKDLYGWIKATTPTSARIVTPPVGWHEFTWVAERATVAQFKLFPQTKEAIAEWLDRMAALSGLPPSRLVQFTNTSTLLRALETGYRSLTTPEAIALMETYQADYFATVTEHALALPILFHNADYVLYGKPPHHLGHHRQYARQVHETPRTYAPDAKNPGV